MVKVGLTAAESVAALQEEIDIIVHRSNGTMINFDLVKLELLVIGGGPRKLLGVSVFYYR